MDWFSTRELWSHKNTCLSSPTHTGGAPGISVVECIVVMWLLGVRINNRVLVVIPVPNPKQDNGYTGSSFILGFVQDQIDPFGLLDGPGQHPSMLVARVVNHFLHRPWSTIPSPCQCPRRDTIPAHPQPCSYYSCLKKKTGQLSCRKLPGNNCLRNEANGGKAGFKHIIYSRRLNLATSRGEYRKNNC